MQIKVFHLYIGRIDAGIQAAAHLGVYILENAGPGDKRAKQEIPGRGISGNGKIQVNRAVRIQAGLELIQDKAITGLCSEIIDRVEHIFRVQPVDGLLGVYNPHNGYSFREPSYYTGFGTGCQKDNRLLPKPRTVGRGFGK